MGKFGWSYPAGCSGPPDDHCDDTRCVVCGADLPENPDPDTPQFDGFCSAKCRDGRRPFRFRAMVIDVDGNEIKARVQHALGHAIFSYIGATIMTNRFSGSITDAKEYSIGDGSYLAEFTIFVTHQMGPKTSQVYDTINAEGNRIPKDDQV